MSKLKEIAKKICEIEKLNYVDYIASGSFKEAYLVTKNGEEYALKIFNMKNSSERTSREIEISLKFDCYNIGKIYAVKKVNISAVEYLFILEEFLGGGSLGEKIKKRLLSKTELINLGRDMQNALNETYNREIVHRDIKPDNIMYRKNKSETVLVDFGLVRDLNAQSLTQTFMQMGPGTPFFSSPEQLNNKKEMIDWRSDQFALGVTMCYAYFGIHPFEYGGSTAIENVVLFKRCNDNICEKLEDSGLKTIVKMIEPYPIKRFRTPNDLINEWEKL